MSTEQQQQSQQQQANRGILPSETLNALDYLVDRLNASSGRLPPATAGAAARLKDGAAAAPPASAAAIPAPLPVRALLVGTNEGVGLSRSLGTAHTASQLQSSAAPGFSHSGRMSEEVLSSIETVWATLVSAAPPHVMAASAAGAASARTEDKNESDEKKEDVIPPHVQPPHPLLSPLRMGDHIRTVTATYDNCTLIHVHMAPLVVTFVTLPEANMGAIRSLALPLLKVLLEPVRRALVRSRGGGAAAGGGAENAGGAAGHPGRAGLSREKQHQAQQQALPFLQQQPPPHAMLGGQHMPSQTNTLDPVLQQQLYHQQVYEQQQMMLAQQQQQFR